MRCRLAALAACTLITAASTAAAQDRLHVSLNAGEQVTDRPFKQSLTFQQYFEQGDLTLERTIPKRFIFDGGAAVRIPKGLYAGVAISTFSSTGSGTVTAHVPHPLLFNQLRTSTGDATGINRQEIAVHIQGAWTLLTAHGIAFTPFGGPTIFQTEQVFVKQLNLTLANEVFPFDTLAFPGVTTETLKKSVAGYNVGVDMTWRLNKTIGLGALIRYAHGAKTFTPTGGQATKVEVGGLHAGGGLRLFF